MAKQVTQQMAMEAFQRYGNRITAAKTLKITEWNFRKLLGSTGRDSRYARQYRLCRQKKSGEKSVIKTVRRRNLISEDTLLQSTDAETRITVALREETGRFGPGQYMKDHDMRKECRASDLMLWRDIREQEEFWPYAMMVGRTSDPVIYWGNPASIKALIGRGKAKSPSWRTA